MVSNTIAERHVGSNPTGGTNLSESRDMLQPCTIYGIAWRFARVRDAVKAFLRSRVN